MVVFFYQNPQIWLSWPSTLEYFILTFKPGLWCWIADSILSAVDVIQWPEIVLNLWEIRAQALPYSHLHSRCLVHVHSSTQWGSGQLPQLPLDCYCNYSHPSYVSVYSAKALSSQHWNTFPSFVCTAVNTTKTWLYRQYPHFLMHLLYSIDGIANPSFLRVMSCPPKHCQHRRIISKQLYSFVWLLASSLGSQFSSVTAMPKNVNPFYSFCS